VKQDLKTKTKQGDFVAADRARTFVTLLVVIYHAASDYTYFGHGDRQRWIGFDLIVLFADSFFMPLMFFISGLFVWDSLDRKGAIVFLRDRLWRLGIPFLVSIFVLMPIAYYPSFLHYHLPGTTDFNFFHFWARTLTVGPWPSGPVWFLWVLLVLNVVAAVLWRSIPRAILWLEDRLEANRARPLVLFAGAVLLTLVIYVPLRAIVGADDWLAFGPISVQTSRIPLYAVYFLAGLTVGAGSFKRELFASRGAFAKQWLLWTTAALAALICIVALAYKNELSPDTRLRDLAQGIAFAVFCAAMSFAALAVAVRFSKHDSIAWRFLDAMSPVAYGIFLTHFIFIIWLQYAIYQTSISALIKFAFVFLGALSGGWITTRALRSIPLIARMI
jgi:surface polysaccharide O-acyltransferase-like enzyme